MSEAFALHCVEWHYVPIFKGIELFRFAKD